MQQTKLLLLVAITAQTLLEACTYQIKPADFVADDREETERINSEAETLFEEYWQYILRTEPEYATSVGNHQYNDKLTVCGVQCHVQNKVKLQDFKQKAKNLLPSATGTAKDSLQILIIQLGYQIDLIDIGNHLLPISFLGGPQTDLMFLLDEVPTKTVKDCQNLIARYNMFTQQVDAKIELMNEGIRRGITQHERSLKNLETTFLSFDVPVESSPFYEPFKNIQSVGSAEEVQNLQQKAREAISSSIIPGFKKLAEYFKNVYRKALRSKAGVSSMSNGVDFYGKILNSHVTADVQPEDIHNTGLREVARISTEMQATIISLGLKLSFQQFNDRLRTNQTFAFKSGEEAIQMYKDLMFNKIEPKLPQLFKKIPKEKLQIKPAPDFMAGGPKAFYVPGSGGNSTGAFYLDVSSLNAQRTYDVVTLAMHEGIPGHHLQIAYAKEQEGLPSFRRNVIPGANNAFIEGWALYAEFLGNELELYENPYMLYGHLSEEIFRACRLVVDTGIHALGWTRQQAIDYMAQNTASSIKNIETEVDRYITWPGQACSYKFGEIKIKQLRKQAQTSLGSKFDVREFHDVVLSSSGPMSFVEQKVKEYIQSAS
uniref:DUF885 domain-containing protein n=2 Tax=Araneomorphae TaxID=6905 RepID=A0A6B9KL83_9ARAC|nr:DUF885 domain-containing protein [Physocyclus mexicanus]